MGDGSLDEVIGLIDHVERLEQVDDVDAVALGEDELLHLRVPTTGLVAEVQACLQHIAHIDLSHGITTSFLSVPCLAMRSCVQPEPYGAGRPTQVVANMTRIGCMPVDNIGWFGTFTTQFLTGWHTRHKIPRGHVFLQKRDPRSAY